MIQDEIDINHSLHVVPRWPRINCHLLCVTKICSSHSRFGRTYTDLTIKNYFRGFCRFWFAILSLEFIFTQIQCIFQVVNCKWKIIHTISNTFATHSYLGYITHAEYLYNLVFHHSVAVPPVHVHQSIIFRDDLVNLLFHRRKRSVHFLRLFLLKIVVGVAGRRFLLLLQRNS